MNKAAVILIVVLFISGCAKFNLAAVVGANKTDKADGNTRSSVIEK